MSRPALQALPVLVLLPGVAALAAVSGRQLFNVVDCGARNDAA
jgi:hypothetical protein